MKRIGTAFLFCICFCAWTSGQEPGWEWIRTLHTPDNETTTSVAAEPESGEVVLAVEWSGSLGVIVPSGATETTDFTATFGGVDGMVVKYDASGNLLWAFKVGGPGDDRINDVHVDFKSDIYIAGSVAPGVVDFSGRGSVNADSVYFNASADMAYLAKYNPSGRLLWVRFGGGLEKSEGTSVSSNQTAVYLTGNHSGTISFGTHPPYTSAGGSDIFVVSYTFDGDENWHLSSGSDKDDFVEEITCDEGELYITGRFMGNALSIKEAGGGVVLSSINTADGQSDAFLSSFTVAGLHNYSRVFASAFEDNGMGICLDTEHIYIGGTIAGEAIFPMYAANPVPHKGGDDGFICAINRTDGSTHWVRTLAGDADGDQEVRDISLDQNGNLYATGYYTSNMVSTDQVRNNMGMQDLFLVSFTRDGDELWLKTAGSVGSDFGNGVSSSFPGVLYLAGEYSDLISFDGRETVPDLGQNAFLTKLDLSCANAVGGVLSSPDTTIFEGEAITLVLKDYRGDIRWQFSVPGENNWTLLTADLSDSILVFPGGAADYRAFVTSGNCQPDSSNIVTVKVSGRPPDFAYAGEDVTICRGDSTNLKASGGDFYKWEPSDSLNIPDIPDPWARPAVTTSYVVHVLSVDGTTDTDTVTVFVLPRPKLQTMVDPIVCRGDELLLVAAGEGTFRWFPADLVQDPDQPETLTNVDVTTTFRVVLTDEFGCRRSALITVFVYEIPVADAGPDMELAAQFETTMGAKLGRLETGTWSVISGNGVFENLNSPTSRVWDLSMGNNVFEWTVSNPYCTEDSDRVTIRVNDFVIPTVITPNEDGKNDYFQIRGIENMASSELLILNRWGEEVYRAAPYDNNWGGVNKNGEELPEGTYYMVLKLSDTDTRKGYIMIIR